MVRNKCRYVEQPFFPHHYTLFFFSHKDPFDITSSRFSSDQMTTSIGHVTSTPDRRGLYIGIGVGVTLGILVFGGGVIIVAVVLIVNKLRKNPPAGEIEAPLAMGDWVDPQTQKGT